MKQSPFYINDAERGGTFLSTLNSIDVFDNSSITVVIVSTPPSENWR